MPTPSKPVSVLQNEKKSHKTKQEIMQRKAAEKSLLTGRRLKEEQKTKDNEISHREFLRLKKLFAAIEKNDELYSAAINRYCLLKAELVQFEGLRKNCEARIDELIERQSEFEYKDFIKMLDSLQKNIISLDKQVQAKRRMMFDIEKENVMTIASSLRSIPKKAAKKQNPLKEALNG